MNEAEINTLTGKLVRDSKLLADTFVGIQVIGKAQDGQTMIKFHTGKELVIHKKEDTTALLEDQKNTLIDSMKSAIKKLDDRPNAAEHS